MTTDYEYLTEDPVIPNQRYSVVSFAEPKNKPLLEQKETLYAHEFLTSYLIDRKKTEELREKKQNIPEELKVYLEEEPKLETIKELYHSFKKTHTEQLNEKFNKTSNKKNEIIDTAFKVRGSYYSEEEAGKRAKSVKDLDAGVDTYIVEVGKWVPYMPLNKLDIGNIHYDEEDLNNLMRYNADEDIKRKLKFNERKAKLMDKIKEEEKEKQQLVTINEESELEEKVDETEPEIIEVNETTIGKSKVKTSNKIKKVRKWNNRRRIRRKR